MNKQIVSIERSDMKCDSCNKEFTILNLIGKKQYCSSCYLREARW